MARKGKRVRLTPDKFGDHYKQPLPWDLMRERMAEAVEHIRARNKFPPNRLWESDDRKKS